MYIFRFFENAIFGPGLQFSILQPLIWFPVVQRLSLPAKNDESDIDDDDYDDPFVNPAPAETVINKLNTNIDAGLALAPGEDQMPLSVLFDDLAEELSYPRIYCGDMRRFTRKKPPTYSEIIKSELKRYDRR
ncbi:hypothetical protein CDAR_534691, partial [Caerostris darwini]